MALAHDHLKADGPHVALLHAGVADRRVWRDVAPELHALGADVLALDRRGFGETPAGEGDFRHVDDLLEMLDGPTWLVGNSMGGALALDAALVAPEQVAGLVLIAPAVSGAPEGSLESLDPDTARIIQAIMAADEAGDLDAVNRHEAHLWLDGPSSPEGRVGGDARELALDMNAIALRSGAPEDAGSNGVDAWSRLEEIRVPATIAWGELDEPDAAVVGHELERRLRDARPAVVLPGVAHLPSLERPDLVVDLIAGAMGLGADLHAPRCTYSLRDIRTRNSVKIAIVGAGVSGLVVAHRLHERHEVTVFEEAPRVGGHTNTVRVDLADATHHVDTGFIVHNDRNYPRFEALMAKLGVQTQPSVMTFGVADTRGTSSTAARRRTACSRTARTSCSRGSTAWSPRSRASSARPGRSSTTSPPTACRSATGCTSAATRPRSSSG